MAFADDLLLEIMAHMGLLSMYCFRQTSRRAMHLFSSPCFRVFHDPDHPPGDYRKYNINSRFICSAGRLFTLRVLRSDMYCASCREAVKNGHMLSQFEGLR